MIVLTAVPFFLLLGRFLGRRGRSPKVGPPDKPA
jgi:hypothetical protein